MSVCVGGEGHAADWNPGPQGNTNIVLPTSGYRLTARIWFDGMMPDPVYNIA